MTVDDLKELFGVTDDQGLCPILNRKKSAVSGWRKTGVPASVERDAKRKAGKSAGTEIEKAGLSLEDQENIGLIMKLNDRKRRELRAELYRLLAEQERDSLKGEPGSK
jgi:hypothetical protein